MRMPVHIGRSNTAGALGAIGLCVIVGFVPQPAPAQSTLVPPSPGNALFPVQAGLMLFATGHADNDAACKKPEHFDKQREDSVTSTSVLTTSWSDECADRGAETGAELFGVASFSDLKALATGYYSTNIHSGGTTNATVVAMFADTLRFELIDSAARSNCGQDPEGPAQPSAPSATGPVCVSAQASVITGAIARVGTNNLAAGVYNVKVCVDPVAGASAVRVTSESGTDYSNAANSCY